MTRRALQLGSIAWRMRRRPVGPYSRTVSKRAGRHVLLVAALALTAAPAGLIAMGLIGFGLTPVVASDPGVSCGDDHPGPCSPGPAAVAFVGGLWLMALLSAVAAIPLTLAYRAGDLARQWSIILLTAAVTLSAAVGGLHVLVG